MAGQSSSTTSALPAAAHVVGNAFVNQYYNVLHQSPQVVHRFYTDASRLTRAEAGPDGAVDSVISQSDIHQKVMALDYGDFKAEIITVDSQDSLTGGVLVMVTGSLYKKLTGRRNFVQSFFLAPQEKGYFVLNDIFRYLDEDESQTSRVAPVAANGLFVPSHVPALTEAEPSLTTENVAREVLATSVPEVEPMVEEIFESAEQIEALGPEDVDCMEDSSHLETTPVIDEPPSPMAAPSSAVSAMEETSEDVPKKSYASIVSYASILRMKENAGATVQSITYTAPKITAPVDRQGSDSSRPSTAATTVQDTSEDSSPVENEGSLFLADGRSVYVKNLPLSISASQLEEEFGKFGLVKAGGVSVKSQKQGVCYAFVEFEEGSSAQTAIESSPISVGGRQVYIEEKRPMGPRASGRGGRLPGVGRGDRSFRSDGFRGRGTVIGRGVSGRGGGQDRDRENLLKGRGTGPVRSGSGNFGGGSNSNSANSDLVGTNGSGVVGTNGIIDNSHRDIQAGHNSRVTRRGGSNLAPRDGVLARGSQHVSPI